MKGNLLQDKSNMSPTMKSGISLIFLAIVVAVMFITTRFYLVDDAYITFRYAENLAYKGDLVFNLGERVEGITNLSWALILALQLAILNFPLKQFALFLSLGFIVFSAFRLWQLGSLLGRPRLTGVLAALLLVLNPEFIGMATNGLEGALYSALLIEIIYRYSRNQLVLAYLFSGFLFMTRPESAFFGFVLVGLVWMETRSIRQAGKGIAIFGGSIVLVTLFRLLYYGMPIPNSVIAKSFDFFTYFSLEMVVKYFKSFGWANPYLVIVLAWALWELFKRKKTVPNKSNFVFLFCIIGILFSFIVTIRNGGDWMSNHRLLLQYGVLYSVIFIFLVRQNTMVILFASALVVLPFLQTTSNNMKYSSHSILKYEKQVDFWSDTTKRLGTVIKESDVISAEGLGYISYYLPRNRFHDPVGLTDLYIARYGVPSVMYGKNDNAYTVGVVSPSVMVWQYAGHMNGVEQRLLDNYETFCAAICNTWDADIVMIRQDRLSDLSPAFADWKKIKVKTNWIGVEK